MASRSESVAVAEALIECLQYVILKNQSEINLCKKIISEHVITTIEWCLIEKQACHKTIFNHVASLAQYWSRNHSQVGFENYSLYLEYLFDNITSLLKDTLFNVKSIRPFDVIDVSSKQIELLQCLKHFTKSKKLNKVQFTECNDSTKHQEKPCDPAMQPPDPYLMKLYNVVFNISVEYVKYIEEYRTKDLMKHFYSLVVDFDTKNFFYNLTQKMKLKEENFVLINIFDNILYKWLMSSDLSSKHVVDLIFLLYNYVDGFEQEHIMNTISKVTLIYFKLTIN